MIQRIFSWANQPVMENQLEVIAGHAVKVNVLSKLEVKPRRNGYLVTSAPPGIMICARNYIQMMSLLQS